MREDCVREAISIIEEQGLEELSLREVARRLGVSHQAPYRHYPSRDALLAEVVSRAFRAFAQYLDARPKTGDPVADLRTMGEAYLRYAVAHPLRYRLMFATPLPDPKAHPNMMRDAQHAFLMLSEGIAAMRGAVEDAPLLDAMFVWSTLHGYASVLQTQIMEHLPIPKKLLKLGTDHLLSSIGYALSASRQVASQKDQNAAER